MEIFFAILFWHTHTTCLFSEVRSYSHLEEKLEYRDDSMSSIPPSALAHLNASKIAIQSLILGMIWFCKTGLEGTEELAGSLTGRSVNVAAGSEQR